MLEVTPEVATEALRACCHGVLPHDMRSFAAFLTAWEAVRFDAHPDDGDGFLFSYGPWNWLPAGTFVIALTRQLAVPADDPDDASLLQVSLELVYPSHVLAGRPGPVRGETDWWFRGDGGFPEWAATVLGDGIWSTVRPDDAVSVQVQVTWV